MLPPPKNENAAQNEKLNYVIEGINKFRNGEETHDIDEDNT